MGKVLILITIIASFVLNGFLVVDKIKNGQKDEYLVTKVVDGDTLIIGAEKNRARLSNIEAPELTFCGGKESFDRLKDLVENKKVKVVFMGEDTFNRSIVQIFIDGKHVNEILLAEGLVDYDGTPNQYRASLFSAYQKALNDKIGIWGKCRKTEPDDANCVIKGNIEKQQGIKSYFYPGCPVYPRTIVEEDLGERWFCSEKEAEDAGFVKSKNCFGKVY